MTDPTDPVDELPFAILNTVPHRLRPLGRRRQLMATVVRELVEADIATVESVPTNVIPAKPQRLRKLRDSHHRLARALALGLPMLKAAQMTGYSYGTVACLKSDPSFADLVESYRKDIVDESLEYSDVAIGNMVVGERLLADSLEDLAARDEPIPLGELRPLLDIISDRADRFGFPKRSTQVNVNVEFGARLEAARRRSHLTLDAKPTPEPTPVSDLRGSSGSDDVEPIV